MIRRQLNKLFAPVDIASLVVFRVLFGAIMIWEVCRYFQFDWIDRYYIKPEIFFTYYGFSWVRPWPGNGMYWHFVALGVLAFFMAVGFLYRLSALLFFLGFTYVFLLDQANYLNHFYFISLISFLMIFIPAHHFASVDAWRKTRIKSPTAPAWGLILLRAQLAIVYIFAGIAKINEDFLCGEPIRMWLAERADWKLFGRWPIGELFLEEWVVWLITYGGLLFDLFIVPLLFCRRTRLFGLLAVALFHLMNSWLFQIGIFPWISLAASVILFLDPSWPRTIFRPILGSPPALDHVDHPPSPARRSIITTLIGIYLAVQILVPLRHWLYPGSVHWTEEGHRFSWRMKLRDKEAEGSFWIFDPDANKVFPIHHRKILSARQYTKMLKTPDMILQFAHYVARREREEHQREVEVHANIVVSLNGRDFQLMIDPTVNLVEQKRNLGHAAWILPLDTPLKKRNDLADSLSAKVREKQQAESDDSRVNE